MVAGLEKCIGVFRNENKGLEALSYKNSLEKLNTENQDFINNLRKANSKFNWIKPDQVPFEIKENNIEQLTFADEERSSVLEMRFKNPYDGNLDVLYFYFKNNIGNFKLTVTNEAMTVAVKEVIQNLLYNQIHLLLETNYSNSAIHYKIASTINNHSLENKLNSLKQEKFSQVKEIYDYLLLQLTSNENTEFSLSKEAIEKIESLKLPIQNINKVLSNSLEILVNKHVFGKYYEITAADIISINVSQSEEVSVKTQQLSNTAIFLDKYENAAKILLSKNEKITGLNIGNNCYPAISPAAISDILKKHQSKIKLLLNQNPNKWDVIRNNFKPIINIVEKSNNPYFNELGA